MIYIEIINNIPTRSTNSSKVAEQLEYQNVITTEYEDYHINSHKYLYQNGEIVLNPNYEEEERKRKRKIEILNRLDEIDYKSIRALRADEQDRLAVLEAEAIELREELRQLESEV